MCVKHGRSATFVLRPPPPPFDNYSHACPGFAQISMVARLAEQSRACGSAARGRHFARSDTPHCQPSRRACAVPEFGPCSSAGFVAGCVTFESSGKPSGLVLCGHALHFFPCDWGCFVPPSIIRRVFAGVKPPPVRGHPDILCFHFGTPSQWLPDRCKPHHRPPI